MQHEFSNKKMFAQFLAVITAFIIAFAFLGSTIDSLAADSVTIQFDKNSVLTRQGFLSSGGSSDARYQVLLDSSDGDLNQILNTIDTLVFPSDFVYDTSNYYYFTCWSDRIISQTETLLVCEVPKNYVDSSDYEFKLGYVEGNIAAVCKQSVTINGYLFDINNNFNFLQGYGFTLSGYTGAYGRYWSNNIGSSYLLSSSMPLYVNYNYDDNGMFSVGSMLASGGGINVVYDLSSFGGGSAVSSEDSSNNLYFKTADITWNIPDYWGNVTSEAVQPKYTDNWGTGSVVFRALCNDFQINNLSDYHLIFNYSGFISGGHYNDTHVDDVTWFASKFNSAAYSLSLSDFYNGGQSYSTNVTDIFDRLVNNSGASMNDYIVNVKNYDNIKNFTWHITVSVYLEDNDDNKSGLYSEDYSFISQVSVEKNNDITTNNNPYIPDDVNEDNLPSVYDPDTDDTGDSGSGNGVVQRNVQTVNINNDGSKYVPSLLNTLLPEGNDGGLTQSFKDLVNQNGWVQINKSVLSFVPDSFWNNLVVFSEVILGLIAAAFCLRLILDLL